MTSEFWFYREVNAQSDGLCMSSSSPTLVCFNYLVYFLVSFSFRRLVRAIGHTRCCT